MVEAFWAAYREYCPDNHFRENARSNFNSMVWQMRLTILLKRYGLELLKVSAQGPDIRVKREEVTSLVETVAARPGVGADAVPPPPEKHAYHPPFDKIILRIRNSISVKVAQRLSWVEAGVVQDKEPFIIAITSGEMSDSVYPPDEMSFAERAVFPVDYGAWHGTIGAPLEDVEFRYGNRTAVKRSSGSLVSTTVFTEPEFSKISAIAYSPHHLVNYALLTPEGRDVQLIHNPLADHPVPKGYFGFGEEVWVEDGHIHRHKFF